MTSESKNHGDLKKIDEESFHEQVTYIDEKDVEIVFENEEKIHRKFERNGPLKKYLDAAKNMFAMLRDYKNGTYREMPWQTIGGVAVVLLYVLNPLDIIPDFIPVLGFLDDAGVLALALGLMKSDFDQYMEWRAIKEGKN